MYLHLEITIQFHFFFFFLVKVFMFLKFYTHFNNCLLIIWELCLICISRTLDFHSFSIRNLYILFRYLLVSTVAGEKSDYYYFKSNLSLPRNFSTSCNAYVFVFSWINLSLGKPFQSAEKYFYKCYLLPFHFFFFFLLGTYNFNGRSFGFIFYFLTLPPFPS